jgi:hypothetical protein
MRLGYSTRRMLANASAGSTELGQCSREAETLLAANQEAARQSQLNIQMARVCLSATDTAAVEELSVASMARPASAPAWARAGSYQKPEPRGRRLPGQAFQLRGVAGTHSFTPAASWWQEGNRF